MSTIHLRGGIILSCDPNEEDLLHGDVLIEGGAISAVGAELPSPAGARVVDLHGAIVLPGLIDAHQHVWEAPHLLRFPELDLAEYFSTFVPAHAGAITPDALYQITADCLSTAVRSGTTFTFDWCHATNSLEHAEAAWSAGADSGSRYAFAYGPPVAEGYYGADRPHPAALELFVERFGGTQDRLMIAAALRGPDLSPEAHWKGDLARARALGVPSSMHVGVRRAGSGAIQALADADLLGPDLQLVHATDASDRELDAAAASGAHVIVPALAELAMGTGRPPLRRLAARGIGFALGVDTVLGAPADMFSQLRAAAVLLRDADWEGESRPPGSSTREVLRGATLDAARAVWQEDSLGSIAVGKRADLLVLRPAGPVESLDQAYAEVVWHGDPSRLESVLIDGQEMLP